MNDIQKMTDMVLKFRDERNWKQFHNPKDDALSLVLEATEVLEHFQWKNGQELEEYSRTHKSEIADELSDVLYWILEMSHEMQIDIVKAFSTKMKKNRKKYPVKKSKNNNSKYTEL